ncbi:MAG: protein kinase [Parachlamydiaceae bacterium]
MHSLDVHCVFVPNIADFPERDRDLSTISSDSIRDRKLLFDRYDSRLSKAIDAIEPIDFLQFSPDQIHKKNSVMTDVKLRWIHHRWSPPNFSYIYHTEDQNSSAGSDHYILKVSKHPHRQTLRVAHSSCEDHPDMEPIPFGLLSVEQQDEAAKKLHDLGNPLDETLTRLVYRILHDHEASLCRDQTVTYPAKYEVVAGYKKQENPIQKIGFELEISSREKAVLIFEKNQETRIGKGSYKKVWKVFSLQEPAVRVHTFSVLHFSQEQVAIEEAQLANQEALNLSHEGSARSSNHVKRPNPTSKSYTYHTIADREETCFRTYSECAWVAKVHRISYYPFNQTNKSYQQQVMEMDYYPSDFFSLLSEVTDDVNRQNELFLSPIMKMDYTRQILQVVMVLHQDGRVYRDFKLENFLLKDNKIYLTDFGYCISKTELKRIRESAGSLAYVPPEVVTSKCNIYSEKLDVWAVGCILWLLWFEDFYPWFPEMMKEQPDFNKTKKMMFNYERAGGVMNGVDSRETIRQSSHPMRSIIYQMMRYHPKDRISVETAWNLIQSLEKDTSFTHLTRQERHLG